MTPSASTPGLAGDGLIFGTHYAVLNLDLMTILINAVQQTDEGQRFISNCSKWIEAVHQKKPHPLVIFTSLFFSNQMQPEVAKRGPFKSLIDGFDAFEKGSAGVQIHPEFKVYDKDIVLQKTRWYAGAGNALEQILQAQKVDTVIIVSCGPATTQKNRDSLIFVVLVWLEPFRCRYEYHISAI